MRGLVVAATLFLLAACQRATPAPGIAVRPGEIEFPATVHAAAFDGAGEMAGYHAVVARGGRAAHAGLLEADVDDRAALDALERAGAKPAGNLPLAAWEDRRDPKSRAPATVIAGPPVEVLLRLPGRSDPIPLAEVVSDSGGRGLEMRFAGNAANIPKWRSGCIVCLYSCPGSKVGNARYTVRDFVSGTTRFRARRDVLPPDGTRIGVILRLTPTRPSP